MAEEEEGPGGVFGLYGEFEETAKDYFGKEVVSSRTILALMECDLLWGIQDNLAELIAASAAAAGPPRPPSVVRHTDGRKN